MYCGEDTSPAWHKSGCAGVRKQFTVYDSLLPRFPTETVTEGASLGSQREQAAAREELGWSNCFTSRGHKVTARELKLTFACFCTRPSGPEVKGYTSYCQSFQLPPLAKLLSLLQKPSWDLEARQPLPPHHPRPERFSCDTTQRSLREMFVRRTVYILDGECY